jgi:sugar/nucleoside kinase (ribokinase family)
MEILSNNAENQNWIVGIGSALVDILTYENDDFIKKSGISKGGMALVDKAFIESSLKMTENTPSIVPGGSACNTVVGVGRLGGKARFIGKCGNDKFGNLFQTDLKKQNVEPVLLCSDSPTGRVLSIITPDAQRSMFTYLGAAAETQPDEIASQSFNDAAIVHVEGYLVVNEALILSTLKKAKKSGAAVSLDLASFTVVEESREILEELVMNYVDILIANEDEAYVFTGYKDELKALKALGEKAELAIIKVGDRGSYINYGKKIIKNDAVKSGAVLDTTGAGDLWASGFLFGLVKGYPLEKCGQLGNICGAEVCSVIGASIPDIGWERIRKLMEE